MRIGIVLLIGIFPVALGGNSIGPGDWEKRSKKRSRSAAESAPPADTCDAEQLRQRINATPRGASVDVGRGTYHLCGETLELPSGVVIQGEKGATLSEGTIRTAGTAQKKANLARTVRRGSQQITLESTVEALALQSGDWIIVAESRDLNNNDQADKGIPQELVQVAAIDSMEQAITLSLRHTLHHRYELSGTDGESAVYKASPVAGSGLGNLNLEEVDVEVGIAQNVRLTHLRLDRGHITPATGPIAAISDARFQDIRIHHPESTQSRNTLLKLDGCSRCLLKRISIEGGRKDAIRLNGIADATLNEIRVQRAPVRSLRIYRGDQVRIDGLTIVEGGHNGGQSANIEQLLLDYTHHVEAQDVRVLRFFQQDAVELRGDCAEVHIRDLLVVEHPTPVNKANTCVHIHGGNFMVQDVSLDGFHLDGCAQQVRLAEGMSNIRIENGSFVGARVVSVDGGRNLVHDMHDVIFRNLEIARERAAFLIRNRGQMKHAIHSVLIDNVHVYGGHERDGSLLNISDVKGLDIVNSFFEPVGNRRILVRGQSEQVRYVENVDEGVHAVVIRGGVTVESQAQRVVRN